MGTGTRQASMLMALAVGIASWNAEALAQKKLSIDETRKTIVSGIKSFEAGSSNTAVQSLSRALSSGTLGSKDMAKALYYRGLSYRKQGKQAQAISDLTSAIWLKNGLSETEKAKAVAERAKAYSAAGVRQAKAKTAAAAPATKPTPSTAGVAQAATQAKQKVAAVAAPARTAAAQTSANTAIDPAGFQPVVKRAASAPTRSPATTASAVAGKKVSDAYSPTAATAGNALALQTPAVTTTTPAAPTSSGNSIAQNITQPFQAVGQNVSSFFSNIFGGGSAAAPVAKPTQLASAASAQIPTTTGSPRNSAVSAWSSNTSIETSAAKPRPTTSAKRSATAPQRVAALNTRNSKVRPAAPARTAAVIRPSKPAGKYRLQIAAVKSRAEADTIASKVIAKHAQKFGARKPQVDETVFGNWGKFYRVHVGPYATTKEPKSVCATIASEGYDCFVIAQ